MVFLIYVLCPPGREKESQNRTLFTSSNKVIMKMMVSKEYILQLNADSEPWFLHGMLHILTLCEVKHGKSKHKNPHLLQPAANPWNI
jgi:hypothetical protein